MDFSNTWLFISISFLLLISPGPNTIYVITQGLNHGRHSAMHVVFGASFGDMAQVLLTFFGLATLFQTSAWAFYIVKDIGAIYLFYIGIKCFLTRSILIETTSAKANKNLILTGFLTSALNPKTTLFFLSFLPQFIDINSDHAQQEVLFLGIIFVSLGFLVMSTYAMVSGKLQTWITKNENIQKYFSRFTGAIFILFGLRLFMSESK